MTIMWVMQKNTENADNAEKMETANNAKPDYITSAAHMTGNQTLAKLPSTTKLNP